MEQIIFTVNQIFILLFTKPTKSTEYSATLRQTPYALNSIKFLILASWHLQFWYLVELKNFLIKIN